MEIITFLLLIIMFAAALEIFSMSKRQKELIGKLSEIGEDIKKIAENTEKNNPQ